MRAPSVMVDMSTRVKEIVPGWVAWARSIARAIPYLGRQGAIKVLPSELLDTADRAARFEREARVLESLNHPNIAHVYGFDRAGDVRYLVMELVEGVTLEERLRNSPLGFRSR